MISPLEHFAAGENLYNRVVAPVCEKYSLTSMEFTVLMFLYNKPQYDTATQIVKLRRVSKSHVSISIRSLQERGLLLCRYLNHDRRTIHLSLTEAANPIVEDGSRAQQKFSDMIYAGFSSDEIEDLVRIIDRIDRNVNEYTEKLNQSQEVI